MRTRGSRDGGVTAPVAGPSDPWQLSFMHPDEPAPGAGPPAPHADEPAPDHGEAVADRDDADAPSYRRFIENITEGYFFYRHDTEGRFTYLSPSVTRVLGYSAAEYRAHYADMFTDNPINREADRRTRLALRGDRQPTYQIEVRARDGTIRHLEVTEYPVRDGRGQVIAVEGIAHDVSDRIRFEARLRELAIRDELTGVFNRRHVLERLEQAAEMARRHGYPLSLAMLDLDRFKDVNDTYGHAAGDRVIRAAAEVLARQLRSGDLVGRAEPIAGRLGGDEFGVVLLHSGEPEARAAIQRVLEAFAEHEVPVEDARAIPLSASAGIATLEPELTLTQLERRADRALYRAKHAGRGRICLWSEIAETEQ